MTSYYINKYEKVQNLDNYALLIDRFELVKKAFEMETKYQFFKLRFLQKLTYIFNNIVDVVYLYTLAESIFGIIYSNPLTDIEGYSFVDSY